MKSDIYLLFAILFVVCGSTMLNLSDGFTDLWPSLGSIISIIASFACLGSALNGIPLSTAYAIWSGLGTALTACIGIILFGETIGTLKIIALAFIVIGVVVLNQSHDYDDDEKTAQKVVLDPH